MEKDFLMNYMLPCRFMNYISNLGDKQLETLMTHLKLITLITNLDENQLIFTEVFLERLFGEV